MRGLFNGEMTACPESSSTLFNVHLPENTIGYGVTSRLMLQGNRQENGPFKPDYSILNNPFENTAYKTALEQGRLMPISKEKLGHEH